MGKKILEINLEEELDSAEDERRVNSLTKNIEQLSYDLDYYFTYTKINKEIEIPQKIKNKKPIGMEITRKKSSFNNDNEKADEKDIKIKQNENNIEEISKKNVNNEDNCNEKKIEEKDNKLK